MMQADIIRKKHGAIYCIQKNIWCAHIDIKTGDCTKTDHCDVGSPEWLKQEQIKAEKIANRQAAAKAAYAEGDQARIFIKPNKKRTELDLLVEKLYCKETQMYRAYKTGKKRYGDNLGVEVAKISKEIKRIKEETKCTE